jgi:hypothetical protein
MTSSCRGRSPRSVDLILAAISKPTEGPPWAYSPLMHTFANRVVLITGTGSALPRAQLTLKRVHVLVPDAVKQIDAPGDLRMGLFI